MDAQMNSTAVRREILEATIISAVDLPRRPAALGAGGIRCSGAGGDQQPVWLGYDCLNEKPRRRYRLE